MSSETKDGGPAFPGGIDKDHEMFQRPHFRGMSLRDYFAGQALAGLVAGPAVLGACKDIALCAYALADAMLAERAKGGAK